MKIRRLAAYYISLIMFSLACALLTALPLMENLGANPASYNSTGITGRNSRSPLGSNNYRASNANAINNLLRGRSNTRSPLSDNSALAPAKPIIQTAYGYTVTLYPMYANPYLIVLTYTVQSLHEDLSKVKPWETIRREPPDRVIAIYDTPLAHATTQPLATPTPTVDVNSPQLTGDNGLIFPEFGYHYYHLKIKKDISSTLLVFDTRHLAGSLPAELDLRLVLNWAEVWIPYGRGGADRHTIRGPFTFDFSMPVDPFRRIAEVNQSATTRDGGTITIERVIATRYDVRVIWRVDKPLQPQPSPTAWEYLGYGGYGCCRITLNAGAKSVTFLDPFSLPDPGSPIRDSLFAASLLEEQGKWIISASYYSTHMGGMYYPDQPGPEFRFTMPPSTNSLQPQD